jgi:hypothetical protein
MTTLLIVLVCAVMFNVYIRWREDKHRRAADTVMADQQAAIAEQQKKIAERQEAIAVEALDLHRDLMRVHATLCVWAEHCEMPDTVRTLLREALRK